MSKLIFAVVMAAAGLIAVMPQPANAGGRDYCPCVCTSDGGVCGRDCGRRCDRGPYGGYERGNITITVDEFGRRIRIRERTRTHFRIRRYD